MTRWNASLCFTLAALLGASTAAHGQPFSISRWTVDGGGMGLGQFGTFIVGGSIGQPDAGRLRTGLTVVNGGFWIAGGAPSVDVPSEPPMAPPTRDAIHAATPNPFAGVTRVSFALSTPGRVEARVYDVRGGLVRTLAEGEFPAGAHARVWDTCDESGRPASPGVYLLRVRIPGLRDVQKLVIHR